MVFNSFFFVFGFALLYPVIVLLRRQVAARNAILLAASYVFYANWELRFLGLLILSTLIDYTCSLMIVNARKRRNVRRAGKPWLLLSIFANLGILGTFKYFNFFAESTVEFLNFLGLQATPITLNVVLPIGVSFYTFQSLSYTIDVYRRRTEAERNLINVALYIAFFPQLIAGPIERAGSLLRQFRRPTQISSAHFNSGMYLFCWGMFKKVVMADNLSWVVMMVFTHPSPGALAVTLAGLGFLIQLHCDFSGYSNMARGMARMMGFRLSLNFDLPILSSNPREFWRRWHITMTRWFRDYLYLPLRRWSVTAPYPHLVTIINLGVIGLWHGANWTFIFFGLLHALALVFYEVYINWKNRVFEKTNRPDQQPPTLLWRVTRKAIAINIHILWLIVTVLFFGADSLQASINLVISLGGYYAWGLSPLGVGTAFIILLISGALISYELLQYIYRDHEIIFKFPVPVRMLLYATALIIFIIFGRFDYAPFIYLRF
jgi:D-alanyl-lipoteichoic acid acyltransferase DltB (MBOAT superfamily)